MVCIAHQYLFLHPDFSFPKLNTVSLSLLKFFTLVTAIGATKKLALSFRKMREAPGEKIVVVPPLCCERKWLARLPAKAITCMVIC